MGHDHHGHSHGPSIDADRKWLTIALVLIASFMVVEVVVGIIASSLALLSDAAHMLTDAGAIALALVAVRLAARPPSRRYTFGLGRAEILAAQANGATLLVLGRRARASSRVRRLFDPPEVEGGLSSSSALLGALVNVGAAWALSRANRRSLNVEGAIAARAHGPLRARSRRSSPASVIVTTGFGQADGIASLIVVGAHAAVGLAAAARLGPDPARGRRREGIDPDAVGQALVRADGIVEVHDLHVWEVTSGFPALAAHVLVAEGDDCHAARGELERLLARPLRHRPHDAAGRPRGRAAPAEHRAAEGMTAGRFGACRCRVSSGGKPSASHRAAACRPYGVQMSAPTRLGTGSARGPRRGPRVAIIGAGLGGLAAALRLQGAGCEVTVLEQRATPGGRASATAHRRLHVGHRALVDHDAVGAGRGVRRGWA